MFQTAVLGSFSMQLKVSEIQRLNLQNIELFFMVSVRVRRTKTGQCPHRSVTLKFCNSVLCVNFPLTDTCRTMHNF